MTGGRRRRRRWQLLAGGGVAGVVTVLATVVAVNVASTPPATPTAMSLAMSLMTNPPCGQAAQAETEVAVFLRSDVTDRQRADLDESLRTDPRVRQVRYESKEASYEKFKQMYRDAPDLVAAVKPSHLPEAFRITMAWPSERLALKEELEQRPGVETVVATTCDQRAGEGE
jgi:cell division protein FtsX